ncbi:MAG: RNA polymerase factor sigma-54 [bacterium]
MRLVQETRLEQKLSPQLIQSLKLLQMPTMELENVLKQELETNPLLEEIPREELRQEQPEKEDDGSEPFDEQEWREVLAGSGEAGGRGHRQDRSRQFEDAPQPADVSLQEHLLRQLQLSDLSTADQAIGEEIIGNIDEHGYLITPVEEIAASAAVDTDDVERVLGTIQLFDPSGVGARDLRECLMIQLREQDLENTVMMAIVEDHLEDVEKHRFTAIARELDIDEADVQEAVKTISRLSPRPAAGRFGTEAKTILPDLIVEKVDGDFVVLFNDSSLPRLRINSLHKKILSRGSDANEETRKYVVEKLNGARWLLRSIQQRRGTMLKVMEYIVKAQREFLERGVLHLKPMTLQEVADAIGMHVSTISRVTNGKYVQTPQGVFELKYFFSGRIENKEGEDVSSKAIKERIERLLRGEDGSKPLSDQKIADRLQEDGYEIARRTIAKYRDQLGILPARYRKQY